MKFKGHFAKYVYFNRILINSMLKNSFIAYRSVRKYIYQNMIYSLVSELSFIKFIFDFLKPYLSRY